ncbi:MAG: hypothetical protein ACM3VT_13150, partial [Solirubrobacterales bacterium]
MSKVTHTNKTVVRETGKVLGLAAILILLMLWLSGTFIYKIRADTPMTEEKAPSVAVKTQAAELRT